MHRYVSVPFAPQHLHIQGTSSQSLAVQAPYLPHPRARHRASSIVPWEDPTGPITRNLPTSSLVAVDGTRSPSSTIGRVMLCFRASADIIERSDRWARWRTAYCEQAEYRTTASPVGCHRGPQDYLLSLRIGTAERKPVSLLRRTKVWAPAVAPCGRCSGLALRISNLSHPFLADRFARC